MNENENEISRRAEMFGSGFEGCEWVESTATMFAEEEEGRKKERKILDVFFPSTKCWQFKTSVHKIFHSFSSFFFLLSLFDSIKKARFGAAEMGKWIIFEFNNIYLLFGWEKCEREVRAIYKSCRIASRLQQLPSPVSPSRRTITLRRLFLARLLIYLFA